jgi:hypothetical protein
MGRRQEGLWFAAECKRMEKTSRGQGQLDASCSRDQGSIASLKKEEDADFFVHAILIYSCFM